MPRRVVERQLRLMPLGEIDPGGGAQAEDYEWDLGEDPWDEILREITRLYVRDRVGVLAGSAASGGDDDWWRHLAA